MEERGSGSSGLRSIPLEQVERLSRGYLQLVDGTIIPLHRVVMVVDGEGRVVYTRGQRAPRGNAGSAL